MLEYFRQNGSQILDGLLFGLGVLAVYLGAIFSGALIRSLSGAGSTGITFVGRYVRGWWDYLRGDDRNIINVTLNMIVDGRLTFDTLVADRRLWFVWPNAYRVMLIRRAAKRTTKENPVIAFPQSVAPKSWGGHCVAVVQGKDARPAGERAGHRERQVAARAPAARGRLQGHLRSADQPGEREVHQRQCHRSRARASDGGAPFRHRADLRAVEQPSRAAPARHGDLRADAAQLAGRNCRSSTSRSTRRAIARCRPSRASMRSIPIASGS